MKLARAGGRRAVTMIELMCVIAIITILASLLLPAVMRSYLRIKGEAEEWEAPEIDSLLLQETRAYCHATPKFRFDSKEDFANKCRLGPKPRVWVNASLTEFTPFSFLDSTNQVVLQVHIGRNHRVLYSYTVGALSITPER